MTLGIIASQYVAFMQPPEVISGDIAEAATAVDATATGYVIFATLVDDPANVRDVVDAFLGQIMVEAANADATATAGSAYAAALVEQITASDTPDAFAATIISAVVAEAATADATQSASVPVTTSYANAGGTGNRTSTITVTTNATLGGGTIGMLVDGSQANGLWWTSTQTSRTITFDFGVGASKVIDEFKWYQDVALGTTGHGNWVFGGSNDNSTYTEFPEVFALGANAATTTYPVTNTFGYRYYRLRQTFNQTSSTPFLREIEFKIG